MAALVRHACAKDGIYRTWYKHEWLYHLHCCVHCRPVVIKTKGKKQREVTRQLIFDLAKAFEPDRASIGKGR